MTFVVTENCFECRYTDCVSVCPVDCFHGDDKMLYIHPEECIDCGACVPECPVQAIYAEYDLPDELKKWKDVNAERAPNLPGVTATQDPLPTAEAKRARLGLA
jgi:ferredoxin